MLFWNYHNDILIFLVNILSFSCLSIHQSYSEKCFCYLNSTTSPVNTTHDSSTDEKTLIHCSLTPSTLNYSDEYHVNGTAYKNLLIQPWAFSNLFINNLIDTLQFDIHLSSNHQMNALNLAGMDSLTNLLARTSLIQWDSCSFLSLPSLYEVTLNCKANYSEYLTFGPLISVIRFVDCEGVPLQFYCIKCLQDSNVNVIRIRPGPPLQQHLVKFTRFSLGNIGNNQNVSKTNVHYSTLDTLNHLPLDSCIYDICSDDMLCRNNLPLQQAKAKIGQPETPTIEIIANMQTTVSINSNEAHFQSTQINTPISTESPSMQVTPMSRNATSTNEILILTKYGHSKTSHRQKIWIVSAIIILIILFIITLGILIVINYQRKLKHKVKSTRSNKSLANHHHHNTANGRTKATLGQHDALILTEDGNRIELPEIVT
uniref:LRRCT domain-containing protein n=1 Tax=Trichobilharzia regenti TaxID=157069 RepID=A0AA85JQR4_TRIRE|nr:unnamed protein product [Trichobilharzia regenti]